MILSRIGFLIPHYIRDPGGSHALILTTSVFSACSEVGWAGSSQWGFRNVRQRPYNRWPEAHACKSHTHALGSPLRCPPAHPTRKRVLAGRQAGWSAECQQCVWDTKMRQTRKPLARKCVQNTYLEAESRFRSVAAWSGSGESQNNPQPELYRF